jgi:hypothetical protein
MKRQFLLAIVVLLLISFPHIAFADSETTSVANFFWFIVIIIIFTVFIAILLKLVSLIDRRDKIATELGTLGKVFVGKYLVGLPNSDDPSDSVECAVNEDNFIFIGDYGKELGRIPRDLINQIFVDDKSQISQRLTVTRMLVLGIFSLAAPKQTKYKEYCLVIDWDDVTGVRHNSIFEFSGNNCETLAIRAANTLIKYIKPKATIIKAGEKKCRYCAEIVKKEAIVCRYCGRDL